MSDHWTKPPALSQDDPSTWVLGFRFAKVPYCCDTQLVLDMRPRAMQEAQPLPGNCKEVPSEVIYMKDREAPKTHPWLKEPDPYL